MWQHLRHIRSLSWFLASWFGIIIVVWNEWSWQYNRASLSLHGIVTLLLLAHFGLYIFGMHREMRNRLHWLILLAQASLVLLLTQLTQLVVLILFLSPVLFLVATLMLRRVSSILILLSGYLFLLLVYINTLGPGNDWSNLWSGGYTPIVGTLGLFFLVVLLLYLQQEQHAHEQTKALLHDLDIAHTQLAAYALRVEELTTVNERQRIARELHDTLSQGLTALVMRLDAAQSYFAKEHYSQGQEIVTQTVTQARTVLTETRHVLHDLRDNKLRPDDLLEMVQEEIEHFTKTTGIACTTELDALVDIPMESCTHVLRVVTEGLTNIARHALAQHVCIRAFTKEQWLEIEITDDGIGFDSTFAPSSGHYGLVGLQERARLIGGELVVTSSPGKGTTLRLSITKGEKGTCP